MDIVSDEENDDIYNFIEEDLMKIEADQKLTEKSNDLNANTKIDTIENNTTITTSGITSSTVTSVTTTATPANTNPFNSLLQMNPHQTLQEQIQQISQQIQLHFSNPPVGGNNKTVPPLQPPPGMPLLSTPNLKFGDIPGFGDMGSPFSSSPESILQSDENNASKNENGTEEQNNTRSGLIRGPLFPSNGPENTENKDPLPPGVADNLPSDSNNPEKRENQNTQESKAERSIDDRSASQDDEFVTDSGMDECDMFNPFSYGGPVGGLHGNNAFGGGPGGPNNSFSGGPGNPVYGGVPGGPGNLLSGGRGGLNNSFGGGPNGTNNSFGGSPIGPNNSFGGGPNGPNNTFGGPFGYGGPDDSFGRGQSGPNNSFDGIRPPFRGPNNSFGGNQGPYGGPNGGHFGGGPPGHLMNFGGNQGPPIGPPGGPFQNRPFSPQMMNNNFPKNNMRGNQRGMPYFRQGGRGGGPGGNRGHFDGPDGDERAFSRGGPGPGRAFNRGGRGGGGRGGNFRGNNQRGGKW